ncbi:MAG: AEC family transporter, partial [Gammaproteobacteria bacterium]|nr:AEC family transporter [Gammaproteobacteria bacterium]
SGVFRQPMMIATLLGLALASADVQLPNTIHLPLSMLGEICIPLMLFTLGMRMLDVNFHDWRIGLTGAILCPLSGLAMAWTVPLFIDLSSEHFTALLLFSVLPPAVLNYMVAEQLQQEPQRVASIVLIGNLSAIIIIPVTLALIL